MLETSCGLMDTHPRQGGEKFIGKRNGISDGLYGEEVEPPLTWMKNSVN
jgi:hypothetical protein